MRKFVVSCGENLREIQEDLKLFWKCQEFQSNCKLSSLIVKIEIKSFKEICQNFKAFWKSFEICKVFVKKLSSTDSEILIKLRLKAVRTDHSSFLKKLWTFYVFMKKL